MRTKMTGNNGNVKIRALRLIAIGLCFAVVFALTLAFAGQSLKVAEATYSSSGATESVIFSDKDKQSGNQDQKATAAIIGDTGDIPATKFGTGENTLPTTSSPSGFPGAGNNSTWYFTETFDTVSASVGTQSVAKGDNNGDTNTFVSEGGKDYWKFGYQKANAAANTGWAISYQLPSFVMKLAQSSYFTVTVCSSFGYLHLPTYSYASQHRTMFGTIYTFDYLSDDIADAGYVRDNYASGSLPATATSKQIQGDVLNDAQTYGESKTKTSELTVTNQKYLNIGVGGQTWHMGGELTGSRYKYCELGTLKVYFKITINDFSSRSKSETFNDGGAPVWANDYGLKAGTKEDYSVPYRPAAEDGTPQQGTDDNEWTVWDLEQFGGTAYRNYPSDTATRLMSYQGTPININDNPTGVGNYYKYTQLSVIDSYNYGSTDGFSRDAMDNMENWTTAKNTMGLFGKYLTSSAISSSNLVWGNATQKYASGLKTLQLEFTNSATEEEGTSTIPLYSNASTNPYDFYIYAGATLAYIRINFIDSYGYIKIGIYAKTNFSLTLTVTDFGDRSLVKTIEYGGIDTQQPGAPKLEGVDDNDSLRVVQTSTHTGSWHTSNNLEMMLTTASNDNVIAPNLYFIAVGKTENGDDIPGDFAGYNWASEAWKVVAILTNDNKDDGLTVRYNFENGQFSVGGKTIDGYGGDTTGMGKYRFRVYSFDMAGNAGTPTDFFVNVDYEKPNYNAKITYGEEGKEELTPAENGKKWINKTGLKINIMPTINGEERFNASGNTLAFEHSGVTAFVSASNESSSFGYYSFVGMSAGFVAAGMGTDNKVRYKLNATDESITAESGKTYWLIVEIADNGKGGFILHIEEGDDSGPNGTEPLSFAWEVTFTILPSTYNGTASFDEEGNTSPDWKSGMHINIDRKAPSVGNVALSADEAAEIGVDDVDGEFSASLEDLKAMTPSQRQWYYERYVGAELTLKADEMWDNYSSGFNVYFGVKALGTLDELAEFEKKDFLNKYATLSAAEILEYLDRFTKKSGDDFSGLDLSLDSDAQGVDLRYGGDKESTHTAGLRLVYVWVTDQAGNCSEPSLFRIFADWTSYTVRANVASSDKLAKNTASIRLTDTLTVQRGESLPMELTVANGFVPYRLSLGANCDLMTNYTSLADNFAAASEAYEGLITVTPSEVDSGWGIGLQFTFDKEDFNDITTEERELQFRHRQVVIFSAGEQNSVTYKADRVNADDLTINIQSDADEKLVAAIRAAMKLRFVEDFEEQEYTLYTEKENPRLATREIGNAYVDSTGNPLPFAAVNTGAYQAYLYIDKYDEAFVEDGVAYDEDGNRTFAPASRIGITVEQRQLYVVPVEKTVVYGDEIAMEFGLFATSDPAEDEEEWKLAEGDGELSGKIKLEGVDGWSADENGKYIGAKIDAGTYRIIVDGEAFKIDGEYGYNYAVNFVANKTFTIERREVEIVILGDSKQFGDADPLFKFGVDATQFGEGEDILAEIFPSFDTDEDQAVGDKTYKAYFSAAITRVAGENVGKYDFEEIDLEYVGANKNYALKAAEPQEKQQFEITKRTVEIAVAGSTSLQADGIFEKESANIGFRLVYAKDEIEVVKQEIQKLIESGLLTIGDLAESLPEDENYSKTELYNVSLNADLADGQNVTVVLSSADNGDKYFVYYAQKDVVVIAVKAGAKFEATFGEKISINYRDNKAKFDVTKNGEEMNYESIAWTLEVEGHGADDILNVGTYTVKITAQHFYKQYGEEETDVKYIAEPLQVSVAPAKIAVKPKFAATTKQYGDDDSAYGISWEIVSVNGQPIEEGGNYAGVDYATIRGYVEKQYNKNFYYVRMADKDGTKSPATISDGVTNSLHLTKDGAKYVAALIGEAKQCENQNFSIDPSKQSEDALDISPRPIQLDLAKFVGVSKDYDGNNLAYYTGNTLLAALNIAGVYEAYDIASQLLFNDSAELQFEARYSEMGSPAVPLTIVTITFAKLSLVGEKAENYVVSKLVNSANNGAEVSGEALAKDGEKEIESLEGVTITIRFTDNATADLDGEYEQYTIYIRAGALGVRREGSVFVTKVYDGKTTFSADNVSVDAQFAANTEGSASTFLLSTAKITVLSELDGNYVNVTGDENQGTKFINLALFFTFDDIDPEQITIANGNPDYAAVYQDSGVKVEVRTVGGQKGILVSIADFAITVNKREINAQSFGTLKAVDREYNAQTRVAIEFTFADGAVVSGDDVGLALEGIASDKNATKDKPHTVTVDKEHSLVRNANYALNVDSINEVYAGERALTVNIKKAQLLPNIIFADKIYNAEAELLEKDFSWLKTATFRSVKYFEQLAEELSYLTIENTATILLSKDGKVNCNVVLVDDTAVKHSVIVRGIKLKVTDATKIDLGNYELAGTCYRDGAKVEEAPTLEDGLELDDLEMTEAILLDKAPLQIMDTNVKVHDKIYDGTRNADIDVALPEDTPANDREYIFITATGEFTSPNATDSATATIKTGSAILQLTQKGKDEKKDQEGLLNNYYIKYTSARFTGSAIKQRPVSATVSLGERAYNALESVSTSLITYTFDDSMLPADRTSYNVQTKGGAFYMDKNVNRKGDDILNKLGAVYNPELKDRNSVNSSNYRLLAAYDKEQNTGNLYAVLLENGKFMLAAEYLESKSAEGASYAMVATDGADTPAQDEEPLKVKSFYYDLPSSAKAIEKSNEEAHSRAQGAESDGTMCIIGYVEISGKGYWLVTEEYAESVKDTNPDDVTTLDKALTYIHGEGKITPLSLSIPTGAVTPKADTQAFKKQYDGTRKFFGVAGTDYTFDTSAFIGKKAGDDVYLENIQAEFNSADTNASRVVFTGTLAGKDKDNYTLKEGSVASANAKIVKRTITATLQDGQMTFGTLVGNVMGEIKYSLGSAEIQVEGNSFYINYYDYLRTLGFLSEGTTPKPEDVKYVNELATGNLYDFANGEFVPHPNLESADSFTYIKLSGDFLQLPRAKASFATSTPNVGAEGRYYLTGGNATNFEFEAKYTGNGVYSTTLKTNLSKLEVIPKDVYVAATRNDAEVVYGGIIPSGSGSNSIAFYDENGLPYSFASGESYNSLFVVGGVDYGPQMKWMEYDRELNTEKPATSFTTPDNMSSTSLAYVARFVMFEGADYSLGTLPGGKTMNGAIKNYRFHFGFVSHEQREDGGYDYYINFSTKAGDHAAEGDLPTDGSFYRAYTSTLTIVKPVIEGVNVLDDQSFEYDGLDKLPSIVTGLKAGDTVAMIISDTTTATSAVNAKTYVGKIKVTRKTVWNESDTTGVESEWISENSVKLTITPATPNLTTKDDSKIYDGIPYTYDYTSSGGMVTGLKVSLQAGDANLYYEKLVGSTYYRAYGLDESGNQVPLLHDSDGYYYIGARGESLPWTGETYAYSTDYQDGARTGVVNVGTYRIVIELTGAFEEHQQGNFKAVTVYAYFTITARPVAITSLAVNGKGHNNVTDESGAYVFKEMFGAAGTEQFVVTYNVETLGLPANAESAKLDKNSTVVEGLEGVKSAGRYYFTVKIKDNNVNSANYTLSGATGVLELTQKDFLSAGGKGETANDVLSFKDSEEGVVANRLVVRHIKSTGGTGADLDMWKRVETYMPAISDNAKLAGIVQVQLYNGNTKVNISGRTVELTIALPENVDENLENVVVYVKNAQGGLSKLSEDDFFLHDGSITFETDYLGEIVFVNVARFEINPYLLWTAVAVGGLIVAFVLWVLIAFIVRKAKMPKLI